MTWACMPPGGFAPGEEAGFEVAYAGSGNIVEAGFQNSARRAFLLLGEATTLIGFRESGADGDLARTQSGSLRLRGLLAQDPCR